jgi:hypothetical protein
MAKKIIDNTPMGTRKVGKPRSKWMEGILEKTEDGGWLVETEKPGGRS